MDEFRCPCCGANDMEPTALIMLDRAREISGFPYRINSGYRCEKHNAEVGGKPTSSHLQGWAVDIRVSGSRSRYLILYGLITAGFARIGIGKDFIHADCDPAKPPELSWLY